MKRRIMRSLLPVIASMAMFTMDDPYGRSDIRYTSPTRCKSVEEIAGYHHEGIYSQTKKLRKGAGHKKLTRAQRKKLGGRKR